MVASQIWGPTRPHRDRIWAKRGSPPGTLKSGSTTSKSVGVRRATWMRGEGGAPTISTAPKSDNGCLLDLFAQRVELRLLLVGLGGQSPEQAPLRWLSRGHKEASRRRPRALLGIEILRHTHTFHLPACPRLRRALRSLPSSCLMNPSMPL